jgi:MFS transporter, DHA3 family, macrolide efflux protein
MHGLFQNTGFRRLWISQIVLALGDAVMQMGLLELFRQQGYKIQTETAKMLFAVSLPGLVFGPLAIAYLDRWQRRKVLMIIDAIRAVLVLVIAAWLLPLLAGRVEERSLFLVYSMIFVIGAATTFYFPARYALLPNLVDADKLIPANTLFTTSLAVAGVAGRPLGGFVAERIGVEWAVLANALAYVVSVGLIWRISMKPHATTQRVSSHSQGGWRELKVGLVYLWRHPIALRLTLVTGVFAFLGGVFIVAFTGYSYDTLKLGTAGLGYLAAAAGPGAAVGVFAMGRGGRWTRSAWLPFGQLSLAGVIVLLLSATANPWLAAPLLMVLGAVVATAMIPIDAKLQEQVDDERRGAVFAARGMVTSATMIVAFWMQFGWELFRRTSAPVILLWLGAGTVTAALLTFLAVRADERRSS